jgi:sugar lactone lactonase YvrE
MPSTRTRWRLVAVALALATAGCSRASSGSGGGRVVVTLATEGNEPNGLAVSGSDVYWASVAWDDDAAPSGWGSVQTVTIDGGAVNVLGEGVSPLSVVVDDTNVYWTTLGSLDDAGAPIQSGQILRTPRAGGATTVLLSGASATTALAIDAQNLYWGSQQGGANSIVAMPLKGGTPTTLAIAPTGMNIDAIAVDANAVYWVTHMYSADNVPSGTVSKQLLATGVASTLAATQLPAAMAVGPGGVYWTDSAKVLMVGLDGGPVTTLAATTTGPMGPIAVDSANVYWADAEGIWKAPLAGGSPELLAPFTQGRGGATGLAVDEASVYWATTVSCTSPIGCAAVAKVTPK